MSAHRVGWIAAWCALLFVPLSASAQLSVFPVQDLAFGQLQPGIPSTIAVGDAARRAQFDIRGTGTYTLDVILPTRMISAQGKALPLSFSNTSGQYRWPRLGWSFNFDPTTPTSIWIPFWESGVTVYLGGTASPGTNQPPGLYTATITVQISNAGT